MGPGGRGGFVLDCLGTLPSTDPIDQCTEHLLLWSSGCRVWGGGSERQGINYPVCGEVVHNVYFAVHIIRGVEIHSLLSLTVYNMPLKDRQVVSEGCVAFLHIISQL